jgi:hypothetical protein
MLCLYRRSQNGDHLGAFFSGLARTSRSARASLLVLARTTGHPFTCSREPLDSREQTEISREQTNISREHQNARTSKRGLHANNFSRKQNLARASKTMLSRAKLCLVPVHFSYIALRLCTFGPKERYSCT